MRLHPNRTGPPATVCGVAKRVTPFRPTEIGFKTAELHGREVGYLGGGDGPVLLLIHGIAGTC